MRNDKFIQSDFSSISTKLIREVIEFSLSEGHNSFAPLGCGGDDFMLFGESRRKEISLRLHSGDVKLLITDSAGGFLFYGGFDSSNLPISFIAKQYYGIIQNVKYLLDNTNKKASITEDDKEKMFDRFVLLDRLYQSILY